MASIDYDIVYCDGSRQEFEDEPCFGRLKDLWDDWDDMGDVDYIEYHHHGRSGDAADFKTLFSKWIKNHSLFGQCIIDMDRGSVSVDAGAPSDLVLGTLSALRSLFDESRTGFRKMIKDLYAQYKDMDLAFWCAECDHLGQYYEESLTQSWDVKEMLEHLSGKKKFNGGIGRPYSTDKTYSSVKSAISGRNCYQYPSGTEIELLRYDTLATILAYERGIS